MANHLITNALLRPHGTNNPYNTLLGDSAVYNNPAVGMYNTQGVADVPFMNNIFKCSILSIYWFSLHGSFSLKGAFYFDACMLWFPSEMINDTELYIYAYNSI